MEIHLQDIIISIINIAVLFLLLRLILWKHVSRFLSQRTDRIRKELDEASAVRENAEALELEYSKKLTEIENQREKIFRENCAAAEEEADRIKNGAKAAVDEMMRDARVRIEKEKEQSLIDAQTEIIKLATEMASHILDREVSLVDNERTVDDFFRKD